MDTRHLTAGATLFLPVFHDGARLSIGDGHAAQGDGEVCGTAIETPMRAHAPADGPQGPARDRARVPDAAPGAAAERPVGRRYATDGVGPDLMTAARDAVRRMIDWLGREHGLAADRCLPAVQRGGRPADQRDRRHAERRRHGPLPAVDLRLSAGQPSVMTSPTRVSASGVRLRRTK